MDLFHLTGSLYRKRLAHMLCCLMNFNQRDLILQFELLF